MAVLRGVLLPLLALISVALTALYVADLVRTNSRSSGCEMTFSWPVYTHLDGFTELSSHRKYSLHSVHMKSNRDELTGVPVLFVPGHMGSYKQARSLSRHLYDIDAYGYDVFAVEFQEELTGLSGNFVEDQARFVNDAVRVILKQYAKQIRQGKTNGDKRKKAPESVVIVAHSMGGVVVRMAELLPNYKRRSIQHVVSLGSPYEKPPFPLDADMQRVYARIHKAATLATPSSAVYLSISGGHKDTTIHSSLSLTDRIVPATHGVAVLASKLPEVGLTVDHLCLVWCHQLLKRVASSIDAVVDRTTRDLIKDEETRIQLARAHLVGVGADDETDALLELHSQSLVDGYHSVDEFASYGTLLPQALLRFFHLRGLSLVWMMYLVVVHIFHLQLAHWQRRFDLQAEPTGPTTAGTGAIQEGFPSLSALLHPAAHAPGFVKAAVAFVDASLSCADKSKRSTSMIGGLVTVVIVLAGVGVELARRYTIVKSVAVETLELGALYLLAIGMLYTLTLVLSASRVVLQPLVLVTLAIARRTQAKRWFLISSVYLLVQLLGHVQDFELLPLDSTPRHLALLVLSSVLVFVLHVLEIGVKLENLTADQQRYRATLFALFALSSFSWIGEVVFFFDVVRFPPALLTNDLLGHAASMIATLALFRYFIVVTASEMAPLPPTAFFDAASEGDGDNNNGVEITAENCPRCVFEDGGPGAVFIEYESRTATRKIRTKQNELVIVGPTFRVVACDCVLRFKQPREYCSFCTRSCRLCGGGSGNYAQAQKYQEFLDQSKTEVALHSLVVVAMELAVLTLLALQKEHYMFYATPALVLMLALYHGLLRHPIEAQRLKKELRKRAKKIADSSSAAKKKKQQKKKSSSAARRKAMQQTNASTTTASTQKKSTTTTKNSTSKSTGSSSFMEEYGATETLQ